MGKLFRAENDFWRLIATIGDVMGLSLLWAVCCLFVLPMGTASASLYTAVVQYVRPEISGAIPCFLRGLKENARVGTLLSIIVLPLSLAILWSIWIFAQMGNPILLAVALVAGLFLLGWMAYFFPTIGRFPYTVGKTLKMTALLAIAHLPTTLLLALLILLSVLAVWYVWCLFVFVPTVAALLASFLLERVYEKHGEENGNENKTK